MIKRLSVKYFKGFKDFTINFDHINLLVGGNNSGKTTIFHALQIFFWCLEKTANIDGSTVTLTKTQLPEIGAIPYLNLRDLFYKQKTRISRTPTRIILELETAAVPLISFEIYTAFSRNVMINGKGLKLTKEQYKKMLDLKPIFIPSTIGITVQEELYREVAQERLVAEGKHNQILRNMVYRLNQKNLLKDFNDIMQPLFRLSGINIPFDETKDEWLTAIYEEDGCKLDFLSAGSGFLQVANIIAFLLLHPSKVALLDEPDSHMHDDLQRVIFDVLKDLAERKNIQLIISTHSPTLIDSTEINSLLLIDKNETAPLKANNTDNLIPYLADMGLSLPPRKIINTLKGRRVLFVEGKEADYEDFIKIFGAKHSSDFLIFSRNLTVFQSEGTTKIWPFELIKGFEELLGTKIQSIYLGDSDYNLDEQITEKIRKAKTEGHKMRYLMRRNRESYLLNPTILNRLLVRKWRLKKPRGPIPQEIKTNNISKYFIALASKWESETQAKYLVFQNPKGSEAEKVKILSSLTSFFKQNYTNEIAKGNIPYRLLDSKQALKEFRKLCADKLKVSFSDNEIVESYHASEIPSDIKEIIEDIKVICKTK